MKLSDILKNEPGAHGFDADYAIVKLEVNIADFQIYYVCKLGGLLFDHTHAGVIYTEILEPSATISAEDIVKINDCLQPEILCRDCARHELGQCKPPTANLL